VKPKRAAPAPVFARTFGDLPGKGKGPIAHFRRRTGNFNTADPRLGRDSEADPE
jgi:hypothetical protein